MPQTHDNAGQSNVQKPRVFISYKRHTELDEPVALEVWQALRRDYHVFIDQEMQVGERWGERIEAELRQSDFLIVLLSSDSVRSEMVVEEVATAHALSKHHGRPNILPVRLAYRERFEYPLSAYLNHLSWAFLDCREDTDRLVAELRQAMIGGGFPGDATAQAALIQSHIALPYPSPLPFAPLESPEGTMDSQSRFYIERPEDHIARQAIERQRVTLVIKAPRQMGKSSLLVQLLETAQRAGKRTALLDFQLFDDTVLADAGIFYRQFCSALSEALGLPDQVDAYWSTSIGNNQRCTRYVGGYLLRAVASPLLLAMDEVERLFDTSYRADFFGMMRNWHNRRATDPLWRQIDLALVTSTEPHLFIPPGAQSPFNVGEIIELTDFTLLQVTDLNDRHGAPVPTPRLPELMLLLGGHPYLVRRALYLLASQRYTVEALFAQARDDHGPFGDHLRHHFFRLHGRADILHGLRQVIRHHICDNEMICYRLESAGLVRRDGRAVVPRCQLYAEYFWERLDV